MRCRIRYILAGHTDASLLGMMRHAESGLALWIYVMAAMHSASIEGKPNTGPQTWSSSMVAGAQGDVITMRESSSHIYPRGKRGNGFGFGTGGQGGGCFSDAM